MIDLDLKTFQDYGELRDILYDYQKAVKNHKKRPEMKIRAYKFVTRKLGSPWFAARSGWDWYYQAINSGAVSINYIPGSEVVPHDVNYNDYKMCGAGINVVPLAEAIDQGQWPRMMRYACRPSTRFVAIDFDLKDIACMPFSLYDHKFRLSVGRVAFVCDKKGNPTNCKENREAGVYV